MIVPRGDSTRKKAVMVKVELIGEKINVCTNYLYVIWFVVAIVNAGLFI